MLSAPVGFTLLLAASAAAAPTRGVPQTCALYFDFTHTNLSDTHFGVASSDGLLHERSNLGRRFDPQGRVTISDDGSSFAFTTLSNKTIGKHFGCCSPTSILTVDMEKGATWETPLHRIDGVPGVKCGTWGCGFLEIGKLNVQSKKLVGWVDSLLPPPPPMPAPSPRPPAPAPASARTTQADATRKTPVRGPGGGLGLALAEFDLETGNTSLLRPFTINDDPQDSLSGVSAYDDKGRFWFACDVDFSTEGICSVETAKSKTNPPVKMIKWAEKNSDIVDIQYSVKLKSVIVLSQSLLQSDKPVPIKVLRVDPNGKTSHWPEIVDLGTAWAEMHQSTISSDGQYLMVTLGYGDSDFPTTKLVTVDLVAKKVVSSIVLKNPKDIVVLQTIPCYSLSGRVVV